MTSKVSDGENTSPKKEKTFEGASNGSRYARSYKVKAMDRSVEKKYVRSKSRTNRPDETPQSLCPMVGPIKVRDRSWLMGDSSNSEESSKSIFPAKSKIVDTQKDEVLPGSPQSKHREKIKLSDLARDEVSTLSLKGKEKGKLPADSFVEETSGSSLSKFRDKVRADDNLFLINTSKAREKIKPVNESIKSEYSLLSGNSPIKLREKMKSVDISKDEMNAQKSPEKAKFGGDDIASSSPLKIREKLKVSDLPKEGAISPPHKDSEKGKGNLLREEISGTRTSPIKLREKNKVSDEFSSGFIQPPKKVKSNSDFMKETSVLSASKSPVNISAKSREKGRMEKRDDSPSRTVVPIKMREKGRILTETTDSDPLVIGISNKSKGKIPSDELKNGGDLILGKKEMIERGPQQGDASGHDHDGIPLPGKREGKIGYSGKTRKLRTINTPLNSNFSEKKPNIDCKGFTSRHDEKAEVSTSEKTKMDISGSVLNDQNVECDMVSEEEIMNCDVSSSQDQKILNKPVTLKVIQNRSASRINDDGEWHPGDLAWGRVGQHPFWPCIVTVDVECGEFKKTQKLGRAPAFQTLHVHFFGDKGRHSWLPSKNILKYEGQDKLRRLSEDILAQIKKKDKKFVSSFIVKQSCKSRWEGAVEEADNAVSLSRDLRKNYFENLLNKIGTEKSKKTKLPEAGDENPHLETKENKRRCTTFNEKVAKKVKSNIPPDPEKDICNRIPRHKTRGRSRK